MYGIIATQHREEFGEVLSCGNKIIKTATDGDLFLSCCPDKHSAFLAQIDSYILSPTVLTETASCGRTTFLPVTSITK